MLPLAFPADSVASDPRRGDDPRRSRSRRPGSRATAGMIALAALAAAVSACTETHVVLEPAVIVISTNYMHTCAIAEGALYCWGKNDDGRLGLGDTISRQSPARVGTDVDWQAVATGSSSTLALKVNGTIWSFGGNDKGQLGLGDVLPSSTAPIQIGDHSDWTAIAIRFRHACALRQDGSLWCWGWNAEGQLGQEDSMAPSTEEHIADPVQVHTDRDFVAVDAGDGHTCAIATDGTLWCWGRNSDAELGQESGNTPEQIHLPVQVGKATDWTVVRSGQATTCGVRGRAAYCWGDSAGMDMAGTGIPGVTQGVKSSQMTLIGGPPVVTALSFDTFGGAVLDDSGGAWLWGSNGNGQLGLGNTADPVGVVRADESGWTQVAVGRFTTCGVLRGRPVCTGNNDFGQLGQGQGDTSTSTTFLPVRLPPR